MFVGRGLYLVCLLFCVVAVVFVVVVVVHIKIYWWNLWLSDSNCQVSERLHISLFSHCWHHSLLTHIWYLSLYVVIFRYILYSPINVHEQSSKVMIILSIFSLLVSRSGGAVVRSPRMRNAEWSNPIRTLGNKCHGSSEMTIINGRPGWQ